MPWKSRNQEVCVKLKAYMHGHTTSQLVKGTYHTHHQWSRWNRKTIAIKVDGIISWTSILSSGEVWSIGSGKFRERIRSMTGEAENVSSGSISLTMWRGWDWSGLRFRCDRWEGVYVWKQANGHPTNSNCEPNCEPNEQECTCESEWMGTPRIRTLNRTPNRTLNRTNSCLFPVAQKKNKKNKWVGKSDVNMGQAHLNQCIRIHFSTEIMKGFRVCDERFCECFWTYHWRMLDGDRGLIWWQKQDRNRREGAAENTEKNSRIGSFLPTHFHPRSHIHPPWGWAFMMPYFI